MRPSLSSLQPAPSFMSLAACSIFLIALLTVINQTAAQDVTTQATKNNETSSTNSTRDPRLTGNPRQDYIYDPNLPRELNGYNLTDYPFYTSLPTDITFKCEGRTDGYYASIPHHCQLFHLCVYGLRHDFLCANYTVFDQTQFICHFVNAVNCSNSEKFYDKNKELYQTTTTEEPLLYDDDYEEEPVRPRPTRKQRRKQQQQQQRRKQRRKQRRRTTTQAPEDDEYYYDDVVGIEDDQADTIAERDPLPAEEEEVIDEPKPATRRRKSKAQEEAAEEAVIEEDVDVPEEEPKPVVRKPVIRPARPKLQTKRTTTASEDYEVAGADTSSTEIRTTRVSGQRKQRPVSEAEAESDIAEVEQAPAPARAASKSSPREVDSAGGRAGRRKRPETTDEPPSDKTEAPRATAKPKTNRRGGQGEEVSDRKPNARIASRGSQRHTESPDDVGPDTAAEVNFGLAHRGRRPKPTVATRAPIVTEQPPAAWSPDVIAMEILSGQTPGSTSSLEAKAKAKAKEAEKAESAATIPKPNIPIGPESIAMDILSGQSPVTTEPSPSRSAANRGRVTQAPDEQSETATKARAAGGVPQRAKVKVVQRRRKTDGTRRPTPITTTTTTSKPSTLTPENYDYDYVEE